MARVQTAAPARPAFNIDPVDIQILGLRVHEPGENKQERSKTQKQTQHDYLLRFRFSEPATFLLSG